MDDATLQAWWARGGLEPPPGARVVVRGADPVLDCRHRPGEAAAAALSLGAAWAAELWHRRGGRPQRSGGLVDDGVPSAGLGDLSSRLMTTETVWGSLTHLRPAADLELTPPAWSLPPSPLGSHPLAWADAAGRS